MSKDKKPKASHLRLQIDKSLKAQFLDACAALELAPEAEVARFLGEFLASHATRLTEIEVARAEAEAARKAAKSARKAEEKAAEKAEKSAKSARKSKGGKKHGKTTEAETESETETGGAAEATPAQG